MGGCGRLSLTMARASMGWWALPRRKLGLAPTGLAGAGMCAWSLSLTGLGSLSHLFAHVDSLPNSSTEGGLMRGGAARCRHGTSGWLEVFPRPAKRFCGGAARPGCPPPPPGAGRVAKYFR